MPFVGIGLHVVIALFFAIHALRTGRDIYWLVILFMFPLLGSIVYFVAVYLPETRLEHTVRKTVSTAARSLDPGRELREARSAFDLTPTAQNQMRLAAALLEAGAADEAAEHYEACLHGPFASDPEIRLGAARAHFQACRPEKAIDLLLAIRNDKPDYRVEQVALLLGQAYGRLGHSVEARREFLEAVTQFGSLDARVEFALWALANGDRKTADQQYREIENAKKHWNKHARSLNKPAISRLEAAFAAAGRS